MNWSSKTIEDTKIALISYSYFQRDGKIYFKNYNGKYGYIYNEEFLKNNITIVIDNKKIKYKSIEDLLIDKWVLD